LGWRLSAREFEEWKVYIRREQLHRGAGRLRHAQLLAAAYQGPSTKRDKKPWLAADFLPKDPWASAVAPATTGQTAAQRMRALTFKRRK
jgi:hypothetical protein